MRAYLARHCVTAILATAYAAQSQAADPAASRHEATMGNKQTYAGTYCQPSSPLVSNLVTYNLSGAFNIDEDIVNLTCPLTRMQTDTPHGITVHVTVSGFGQATEFPINCGLVSMSADGFTIIDSDSEDAELVRDGRDETDVLRLRVQTAEPEGYFVMTCSLSKDFGVVKYDVIER